MTKFRIDLNHDKDKLYEIMRNMSEANCAEASLRAISDNPKVNEEIIMNIFNKSITRATNAQMLIQSVIMENLYDKIKRLHHIDTTDLDIGIIYVCADTFSGEEDV